MINSTSSMTPYLIKIAPRLKLRLFLCAGLLCFSVFQQDIVAAVQILDLRAKKGRNGKRKATHLNLHSGPGTERPRVARYRRQAEAEREPAGGAGSVAGSEGERATVSGAQLFSTSSWADREKEKDIGKERRKQITAALELGAKKDSNDRSEGGEGRDGVDGKKEHKGKEHARTDDEKTSCQKVTQFLMSTEGYLALAGLLTFLALLFIYYVIKYARARRRRRRGRSRNRSRSASGKRHDNIDRRDAQTVGGDDHLGDSTTSTEDAEPYDKEQVAPGAETDGKKSPR